MNFNRPHFSPCLKEIDKNSKSYKKALAIIKAGAEQLARRPRADMPGFTMWEPDQIRKAKSELLAEILEKNRQSVIRKRKRDNATPDKR